MLGLVVFYYLFIYLTRRPINGDGFGVGYYPLDEDLEGEEGPCVFCAITPAWNNLNLARLASKTKSKLVFGHVRASTAGVLSETNCHPFVFHSLMFMHNGHISNFSSIKLRLAQHIRQCYFINVQGATDSEWAFALFLDCLQSLGCDPTACNHFPTHTLRKALLKTLEYIKEWTNEAAGTHTTAAGSSPAVTEPSLLNIAVTDGNTVVVSRYVTSKTEEAASLYYSSGTKFFEYSPGQYRMERKNKGQDIVMIASEPLTFERNDWIAIPTNTMITIKKQTVLLHPIIDEYYDEEPGQPRSSQFAESKGLVSPMVVGSTETGVPPLEREGRRREVTTN